MTTERIDTRYEIRGTGHESGVADGNGLAVSTRIPPPCFASEPERTSGSRGFFPPAMVFCLTFFLLTSFGQNAFSQFPIVRYVSGTATEAGGTALYNVSDPGSDAVNIRVENSSICQIVRGNYVYDSVRIVPSPGVSNYPIRIRGRNNNTWDGQAGRTCRVNFQLGSYGSITYRFSTTVRDDDPGPSFIGYSGDAVQVREGGGTAILGSDNSLSEFFFDAELLFPSGVRMADSVSSITVSYATRENARQKATPAVDFVSSSGSLVFSKPEGGWPTGGRTLKKRIRLVIANDEIAEPKETFLVRYTGLGQAVDDLVEITDDDSPGVFVSPTTLSVNESGTASYTAVLTVQPTARVRVRPTVPSNSLVTVSTAQSGNDLVFTRTNWNTPQTVTVTGVNDNIDYPPSQPRSGRVTVSHSVSGGNYGSVTAPSVNVSHLDDDSRGVTVSSGTVTVTEASGPGRTAAYTVVLKAQPTANVTVTPVSGNTSVATVSGALTFTKTNWNAPQTVTVAGVDNSGENASFLTTRITHTFAGGGYGSAAAVADDVRVNLIDDDKDKEIILDPASVTIAEEGSGTYEVKLSAQPVSDVEVEVSSDNAEVTVKKGEGSASSSQTLTFTSDNWNTAQEITVAAADDTDAADDSATLTHTIVDANSSNEYDGADDATLDVTVTDNDEPAISISSPSVTEGDSGSVTLTFKVTLDVVSSKSVTVNYAEGTGGTATSGTDYTAVASDILTFAAGDTSKDIEVTVTGDALDEPNETVVVTLSSATNASISTATGTGTITDDDDAPTVSMSAAAASVGESDGTKDITVSLSAASGKAVTVPYTVSSESGDTATAGTDYAAVSSGSLSIAAGNSSGTITVTVTSDTVDEPDETFTVTLGTPTNAALGTTTRTVVTITDDDAAPSLSISSPSVTEGDSGSVTLTFEVTLSAASGKTVKVNYADASTGTATSGTDYEAITARTLTFSAGDTSKDIDVTVTGDSLNETDETVIVTLSSATNASISAATGTGTITDDDSEPTVSISSSASVGESDGTKDLTVSLSAASGKQVTVPYTVSSESGDTATAGGDYTSVSTGSLTIAAGNSSGTITVTVTSDTVDEDDETFTVTLGTPTNAALGTTIRTAVTITDDDAAPTLSISSPSVTEGDSGSTTLTFKATLSAASGKTVKVNYADASTGTATSGTDYEAITAGTLTFSAGDTSKDVDVTVTGDSLNETDETVIVTLSSATNASISSASGTGTITDDDDAPTVSMSAATASVGESDGTKDLTVSLSAASGKQVTVPYTVSSESGDTATAGTDYTSVSSGSLSIAAGNTSGTITVTVTSDTVDEADETFTVTLGAPTNATLGTTTRTAVTITDDDAAPSLSVSSPSVTEGDSGSVTITFKATLSAASGKTVKVNYADAGTGTATSGTDYTAFTSGTLTFSAGDTSKDIDVTVTGDSLDEPDETVIVTLSSATNASISAATGTGTITDDDSPPTVSMSAATASVGESAGTKNLTVSLSAASGKAVTVPYTVSSESGDTATAGTDYAAVSSGSLSIAAGNTSGTITVTVTSDTVDEDDETFTVTLGTPTNATLGTTTRTAVTITDDDAAPSLSVSSPSVTEGDSGSVTITFKATLSAASGKTVKVNYADAGTGTATSGTDYTAFTSGTLTFSAGDTSKDIDVTVTGDSLDEPDETVVVTLSSATNASISAATGTGTITDDDDAPTVSMSAATASVGESAGTKNLTVSLSAVSGKAVTVPYTVSTASGDTATAGTDYTAVSSGSLSISAGNSSGTITVTVTSDTVDEPDETFTVTLGTPTNAALHATATRTVVTITDDDAAPTVTLSLTSSTISENGGSTTVTAALSHASSRDTTITLQAVSGFYTLGSDKTIAISAGQTTNSSDTATINAVDDTIDNVTARTGTVTARADNSQGAGAVTGAALTLTDDEATPTVTLSLSDSSISENGGSATVTASLSGESSEKVTLTVSAAAVSPAVAGDFSLSSNKTLTIAAGGTSSSGAVTITANDNTTDAADKSVRVSASVSGASGAANPSNVTLTITDDDAEPSLSISSPSVTEGDSGSVTLTFKATLSAASGKTVKVSYADALTGTATSGTDYEAITAGTLTFSAGDTSEDIAVTVKGDALDEPNETIAVKLSSPVNATISAATGTGTITNDDNTPTASAGADQTVTEGANVTLDGSASSDTDGDTLTYAWSQTSGSTVRLSSSTAQSPTFTAPTELLSNASLVFSLTVSDGVNTSTADTVTITVTAGANDAPTADAGSDATVAEAATVTLDGSGSDDPENAALTYAWSQTSGTTVSLSSSTAQSPTFTAPTELLANASLVFSLTVSDGVNTSTADTVTITVTAGANDAPTADAGSDATVAEGATVTLDGSGSDDPENAALTYAWSQTSGTTVSLSSSTAQSPTFTAPTELLSNASLVFSLKVSDGVNTSTADTVTITVTAGANDAPTADAGTNQTVAEAATVTLDGSGSDDPENAALTYSWSQTSGTTVSLSSSTAQSPTFTAPTELLSNASLVFSLKVSDGVNTSTADTVTITVTAGVNDAPTADAGSDRTVAEGAAVTLDGSGSDDPENAALTYSWSQTSGTTVSLSSSTAQSPTFTAPTELLSNASLVFSLTVSDGVNTSTADTVTITVTAGVNDAPTADAGSDATVAEGATVTLDGSGSTDPENAALTYSWSQTSGTTVSLSSSTAQSPTFTAPTELLANASLVFSLKVSDGVNTSTADTVTITVTAGANDAPTADAGSDATVAEGATVTLDGSGSDDPENAALTYAWSQTSGTTVRLSSSTAQSPTFTAPTELLSNASLVFSLKVSDGVNTSTADTVTITVTAGANDAPTADAGSDATVAEGATVTLDGSGSDDPENAALTYAWSQTSGTTVSLSSSTAQSPTFTAPTELLANASLVFSLKVSDGVNTSTADTVTITVTAGANDAPTADAGSDATVAEGATVTLDGSGSSDPERAALTYAWSQTSGTTVSLSSSTAQSPTFTAPTELLSNASLVFSLKVSDGVNTSTADTVTITVTAGVNDAPTADAGSDATVAEGANVTLDGSGSTDPENAALTYAWSQTSGTTVSLSSSTAQSPTFTAPTELLSNASLVFSLKVSDGVNTSTADTVTITVTAGVNDAPTADAGSDAAVAEGATVTLDGSGSTDPERAALTYAWSQTSGSTVSLSSSTAQSPTFTAPTELLSNASLVFSLKVSDGVNTSTADTVTITVTAGVNDAPTADAGSDATVAEGANVTLDGSGSTDPERAALTYAWSQTSGTTVSLSSSTAQSPTFTAPTELLSNASLVFSLKVSDGVNTSTADTVTITVTAGVNDAPTADAGTNQTVAEGATVTLDGSGSSDPERAALTYAWSQTSGTTVSLSSSTAQSPTFTAPTELLSNASLVFSLKVSDGVNTSTADTVTITVTAGVNDAPTADAGSDATVTEGATVTLDGSGSTDPERAALTYAWSQTSGTTVSLSSSTAQSPTFTAPTELLSNASLVFSLKVSDGVNTSTADTVTITVTAGVNDAPTADAGSDATVAEGANVTLDGSGSDDPENAALTYSWSQTSGTTVSLSSSTAQSPTFTAPTELLSNASLVFSLKVSDGVNTSTADTVTITVTAGANDAPTADAGSDATVAEGATVTLDGSGSDDPERAALTYAWSQTSGTTVSLSSSTAQSPTFTAPTELLSNASLVFSLTVSDGVNTSTADTVTITVTAGANDAPTADAGSDATVAEGATVTLDGSGSSDPERAALTYAWSQTSGTTVSLSSSTAQSPTFTAPTELLSNASLVFSLKVSDGVNTSTADTVTITVTAGANDAPTADAGTNQTVAEAATVTLDGSGSDDPENAALTYSWSQTSGTTVSLSSSTAQSPTFTAPTELLSNASLVFSLKVSDGVNTSTADTVTITVTAGVNDAPTADAGSDRTVAEGTAVTLDGSGSDDPENAALTYAWSQTSGTTVSLSSSTAQSPTFTAPTELLSNASLVFSLTVSDGVNTSTADTVTITVTAGVNDAPTADAGSDATVAEGATVTLDGSGSDDPENAALTYAWSQTSGTTVSLSSSTAQSPTFTAPTELLSNASLVFSLEVSDGVNTSTADTVTITVTAGANDAPTADAGSDATVAEGATVTLDGSGSSDPERAALTYAWSQTSGTTVSLSSSTAQSPTFTAPTQLLSNASLVFSLKVSDGVNTSTADTVTITVTAGVNDAPTADAGSDATVAEGENVTLDGSGSDDPENAALTYSWSQTSGTTVSLSSSTAQSPTFTAPTELLSNASLVFSLTVSDGVNTSTADTVTITVTAGANPPAPDTAPLDQTPEFSPDTFADQVYGKNLPVDVTLPQATGGDGELSYGLEPELPEGLGFDATTLAISGVPTEAMAPTPYTLTATDADGDSATLTFSVAVEEPVLISVSDAEPVAEGASGETALAEFEVSLSRSSSLAVTVSYSTRDSTAEAATDYSATSGVLTFSPGETGKTVSVTVNGDDEVEADETFALRLADPSNGQIETGSAQAVILNDDEAVVSAEACGNTFPVGGTTVRVVCAPDPGIDLTVVLPARLTRNGVAIEEVTVTLAPSAMEMDAETFGFTGTSDHHSLVDIDVSPVPDDEVTVGLPVTPHLRRHAGDRRLFVIRHAGSWEELESSPQDHRMLAEVNAFSPFAVTYEMDLVERRIANVNKAILPELSRAMTSSALDAVTNRIKNAMSPIPASINGFSRETDTYIRRFAEFHLLEEEGRTEDPLSWREALDGSSFDFLLAGGYDAPAAETHPPVPGSSDRGPAAIGAWAAGDYRRLSGGPDSPVGWSGGLFSGHVGMDVRLEKKLLAGVAASWSQGSFDYSAADGAQGRYLTAMKVLNPYMAVALSESVRVWTVAGFGLGKIHVEDDEASRQSADAGFQSGALGASLLLLSAPDPQGGGATTVDLKAEMSLTRMEVEDNRDRIRALEVKTNRLRFVLTGAHAFFLRSGASVEPFAELGLRRDGGDGETGLGVEMGGGVGYRSTAPGFALEARARMLRTHQGALREWGVDGAVRFDSGADGRGLSFSALPSYGESVSATESLWRDGAAADSAREGFSPSMRFETEVGYGFPALARRGLLTPYGAFARGQSDVSYRAGSRFSLGPSFDIDLEGQRREPQGGKPEHGIVLTGRVSW